MQLNAMAASAAAIAAAPDTIGMSVISSSAAPAQSMTLPA